MERAREVNNNNNNNIKFSYKNFKLLQTKGLVNQRFFHFSAIQNHNEIEKFRFFQSAPALWIQKCSA